MGAHTGLHQDAWLAQMLPQQFRHSFFLACSPCHTLHGQTSLAVELHTPLVVSHGIGGGVRGVGILHYPPGRTYDSGVSVFSRKAELWRG